MDPCSKKCCDCILVELEVKRTSEVLKGGEMTTRRNPIERAE